MLWFNKSCKVEETNTRRSKYCLTCKSLSNYKLFFKKLNIEEVNYKIANKKAIDLLKKEYNKLGYKTKLILDKKEINDSIMVCNSVGRVLLF